MGAFVLPKIHVGRLPPLFCLSVGALLGVLLTAFVLEGREIQKRSELVSNYGNALVSLVAQNSAEPIITDNLLGLHAVMQNIVAIPRVQMAVVHDVNQVLLAQAGTLVQGTNFRLFTASIPLHDSMAGIVTITVDVGFPGESTFRWVFIGALILLLLMSALALYESRADVFLWERVPDDSADESDAAYDGDNDGDELPGYESVVRHGNEVVEQKGWEYADLVLSLTNYPDLEKQLSDIVFSRRVASFERQFNRVLSLYDGYQVESPGIGGVYCLRFKNNSSLSEAVFSAVCTAFLIQSMERSHKIKFHMLAEICAQDADIKLSKYGRGIFVQKGLLDGYLEERLSMDEAESERKYITGFHEQYAAMLEKQVEQLQDLL